MHSRLLAMVIVLGGAQALAQDAGADFDGAIPDASVGIGGADQNSEENVDGTSNTVCSVTRDCESGFACKNNHCTYVSPRAAGGPCAGGTTAAIAFPLLLAWRWRRRSEG